LATVVKNRILRTAEEPVPFDLVTPTPRQQRLFDLLGVNYRMYPMTPTPFA
jgi:hypothetical protein